VKTKTMSDTQRNHRVLTDHFGPLILIKRPKVSCTNIGKTALRGCLYVGGHYTRKSTSVGG